ncbi:hypothetical protein HID58_083677 [Brassica napus]|uniref:BHLH domain-containing protein n=1 Tax=Brassica napus TaxID=3708 RepID=A0ABQ7YDY4_BRANA|nr:hypothetical protein HID58_083677 [Brassica napus]
MMRGVERVKEFLRPLVDSRDWDFCVIWKLGDDPSRFIEWVGCCCSGSYTDTNIKHENVEEEEEEEEERQKMGSICRDEHNKHHIRSLSCEALSRFPLFIPLYPGIHGEVVMSKSPKWLVNSSPGSKQDIFRTRVLVPVRDGLVELFSFMMKPVDESMVDLIISRCNAFLEQSLPCLVMNKEEDVVMQDIIDGKANKKLTEEHFKSKNLHSERKRRERINQRIYALRALVPVITKVISMNKNGTISDAVDYINELLVEKQTLEDELSGINEIECRAEEEAVRVSSKLNMNVNNEVSNTEIISIRPVNLEVHETGEGEFLIRVTQEHKRDGFKRLIEAVDSCGLEIINVNVTRLDLTVMTILNVKANKYGITREDLRDLLFKMIITSAAVSVKHCT